MFKEERKDIKFNWADIGDISAGREHLGESVSVALYRMLQFSVRNSAIKHVGVETANKIFFDAGFASGVAFFNEMMGGKHDDFPAFVRELQRLLREKGIGILRMEETDLDNLRFVLTVSEDLDCSGLPPVGETVCVYDEGFIAGVFQGYTGKQFKVKEVDCWGTGERVCRFVADAE